ncbi:C2H2-type domain-containing protein [Plasmodiophora brassicae]
MTSRVDDFGRIIPASPDRSRSPSSSRSQSPPRRRRGSRSRSRSPARRTAARRSLSPRRRRGFSPRRSNYRTRSPPRRSSARVPLEGPLLTYKQFADMQGGTVSQDAYAQYKEDFILRQDRKFFHQYKDEEWLQERYHPLVVLERSVRAVEASSVRRDAFKNALSSDHPEKTFPSLLYDLKEGETLDGDMQTESNAQTFYENALFIRSIPSSLARSALRDAFAAAPGFDRIILSEPNRLRGFSRFGWAFFHSQADCAAALKELQGKPVNSWYTLSLVPNSESNRQPKFAPSIALTPERIATDLSQATLLAHKLDAEAGSEPFDFPEVSGSETLDNLRALNIVQTYLRFVYNTCYYCALCAIDEEELRSKCQLVHRRAPLPCTDGAAPVAVEPPAEALEQWASELDKKIGARIIAPAPSRDPEVIRQTALTPFIDAHTSQESESKFRCGLCAKLFRGAEFVAKHLKLKHPNECEEEIINRVRTAYFEAFRADPDRPQLPPSTAHAGHPSQYGVTLYKPGGIGRGSAHRRHGFYDDIRPGRGAPSAEYPAPAAPVPDHLKRRRMVSYADLDAPVWSPPKEKKLDYGFGGDNGDGDAIMSS